MLPGTPSSCNSGNAILNNGAAQSLAYCLGYSVGGVFYCNDSDNGANTSAFSVSGSGVTPSFAGSPSQCGPGHPSTFDLSFTAAPSASPTSRNMSLVYSDRASDLSITLANALHVYDTTPVINGVGADPPPIYAGSQGYVSIYGSNFGSGGYVQVCTNPTGSCAVAPGFSNSVTYWPSCPSNPCQINILLTTPSYSAGGTYYLQVVVSTDVSGATFLASTQESSGSASNEFPFAVAAPTVTITSRPITVTPGSTPGQYVATLTSVASPAGGSYTWSTSNTSMVGFTTPASGLSADHVTLGVLSTNDNATITLTYVGPYGGTATDSFTFALTNDTVAVAWVDSSKIVPDTSPLPLGILDPIVLDLYSPLNCATTVLVWEAFGQQGGWGSTNNGLTSAEIVYANQFLLSRTGNPAPPQQMTDNAGFLSSGNYRMYQRLQASYEVAANIINPQSVRYLNGPYVTEGTTPEPCSGLQLFSLPVQTNAIDGKYGVTSDSSLIYQVNETRLGPEGQAVNQFLNGVVGQDFSAVTAWIWSVVQFDVNGKTRAWQQGSNTSNLQIFPTYQIYTNGFGLAPTTQGSLSTFIGLNATSQYTGQQ